MFKQTILFNLACLRKNSMKIGILGAPFANGQHLESLGDHQSNKKGETLILFG